MTDTFNTLQTSRTSFSTKVRRLLKNRAMLIVLILSVVILGLSGWLLTRTLFSNNTSSSNSTNNNIQKPSATTPINRELSFPIKDEKGQTISQLKFSLTDAQLTNEIIVKGQKATSVAGRQFLIVNLKIVNDSNKKIQIDTRDYLRLSVNGNQQELLAPDIHNDPVEVQALSTKYTRLGFPINVSDNQLKLKVGEINGDKTDIDLSF